MKEYLIQGKTLFDIANAIRAKSGTAEVLKVSDFAAEIENISGRGPSEKVILAEQTFEGFALDSNYGAYIYSLVPAPYALTVGETYLVKWDGTEYECVAQDLSAMSAGMVAIGNISALTGGGAGNNEPFIINYVQGANAGGFLAFDNKTSHTVKIYQKVSGGGSVEGVHFVTFMSEDGSTELYKRPVADGDDCADPVIRGYIDEPTKESTAQYAYTLAGWSAAPNGALDGNILKAVTEDKTVYANYAAVLRYYTVTYLDDDGTVLKTENLAYGATPNYKPTKDGYDFVEWTPKTTVTGDTSYTATWKAQASFATASWAEIDAAASDGTYAEVFALGDTRTVTLTYSDGTTEDVVFEIVDMDLSNSDSTRSFASNAKMAIMAKQLLANPRKYNDTNMNGSGLYYTYSSILTYLKNDLIDCFPTDMQAVMKTLSMPYANGDSKVHIPTMQMLGKGYSYTSSNKETQTPVYALEGFPSGTSLVCKTAAGTAQNWWVANAAQTSSSWSTRPLYVSTAGKLTAGTETNSYYIRPIFFI